MSLGADPTRADEDGLTPLHWACARGNTDCAAILLRSGTPINAMDYETPRRTPLDLAIGEGYFECVGMLRAEGSLKGEEIDQLAAQSIQKSWKRYKVTLTTLKGLICR